MTFWKWKGTRRNWRRFGLLALVAIAGCASKSPSGQPPDSSPSHLPAVEEATDADEASASPTGSVFADKATGIEIVYSGGSPQAAVIIVRKRFGDDWKQHLYTVMPRNIGQGRSGEIGGFESGKGKDGAYEFDFRTGFVLTGISKARYAFKRLVRRTDLRFGGPEVVEVDAERDRYRIEFTDATGATQQLWMADEK